MSVVHSIFSGRGKPQRSPIAASPFPADAHALIYKPARAVTMSAPYRKERWKLRFERRTPLRIEPVMGWTEDDDPLSTVELSFPSAEAAMAYARRQGLRYTVLDSPAHDPQLRLVSNDEAAADSPGPDLHQTCSGRKLNGSK